MSKFMYYCDKCGYMYAHPFGYEHTLSEPCPKCGHNYLSRTGTRKIPTLTEEEYEQYIATNTWDERAIKKYCLIYYNCSYINKKYTEFTPKCPTCGCTEIRKISATEKVVNIGMFGLLGNKRKYQFECLNPACKYKW